MAQAAEGKVRLTATVPVTTMEEVIILTDEERAEMLASLKAAEKRIAVGEFVEHDRKEFVDRLLRVRASVNRNKNV